MEENGARLVSSAMLGLDGKTVMVNGKVYLIKPPTIRRIAGAAYYLSSFGDEKDTKDILASMARSGEAVKALSFFIVGDASLADELMDGTMEEVTAALAEAIELMSAKPFFELSRLARSVKSVTAKPR